MQHGARGEMQAYRLCRARNCAGVPNLGRATVSLSFVHHHVELCVRVSPAAACTFTGICLRVSLYLDPQIRDWVLFPITLVMVSGNVRSYVHEFNLVCRF